MTLSSYDAVIEDSALETRAREQQALNHGIDLLSRLQNGTLPPPEDAEALLYIRRLWAFFVQDLSSPRNGLPEKLRADLISVGLMKKPICISLRGGERIYVNGAVLRVDRKVTLELINDVAFLLESQVMQVADATTPMRQLYFVVQLMLMAPHDVDEAKAVYREQRSALLAVCENAEMLSGLEAVEELVEAKRYYDALRKIRTLFDVEQSILNGTELPRSVAIA